MIELSSLETCAHTNIIFFFELSRVWLQVGQAMIQHTQDMLYMSREFFFFFAFNLKDF